MQAIYAIYVGLVNPRRSYSQPSLPFALCLKHHRRHLLPTLHRRLCLSSPPLPQKLPHTSLIFYSPLRTLRFFSAILFRSNALKPICRQTPLVACGAATAPATQGFPRINKKHASPHSPPPHLSLIRPALRPTPTRHFRQNQQRKPTIFLPVCQQK